MKYCILKNKKENKMQKEFNNNNVDESAGQGHWKFILYKPEDGNALPNFIGYLRTNTNFHTVGVKLENGSLKTIASIPSGNVAAVYDVNIVERIDEKLKEKATASSKK